MNRFRFILPFAALLALAACNQSGAAASQSFNAAGQNLGEGHVGSGATDIGHGFSYGANATGQAITQTAHQVGNSLSN